MTIRQFIEFLHIAPKTSTVRISPKQFREYFHLSQQQVAEDVGFSQATISRNESIGGTTESSKRILAYFLAKLQANLQVDQNKHYCTEYVINASALIILLLCLASVSSVVSIYLILGGIFTIGIFFCILLFKIIFLRVAVLTDN